MLTISLFSFSFLITTAQNVGIGNTNPQAALDVQGDIRYSSTNITLAAGFNIELDATTTKANVYNVNSAVTFTGIIGGIGGRVPTIVNTAATTLIRIKLLDEGKSLSTVNVGKKIAIGNTFFINYGGSIAFRYDGFRQRWAIVSKNGINDGSVATWQHSGSDLYNTNTGNVGVGTNILQPSELWEIKSNTKGFLQPCMSFADRNLKAGLATGLIIWCADCDELQVFNGILWKNSSGTVASEVAAPGIKICNQTWLLQNLAVSAYQDGTPIPQATSLSQWNSPLGGIWCWYNFVSAIYSSFGKFYKGYALNYSRGQAAPGRRVPRIDDVNKCTDCLGGYDICGKRMRTITNWNATGQYVDTNRIGFSGTPAGKFTNGAFFQINTNYAHFWLYTDSGSSATTDIAFYTTFNNLSINNAGSDYNGFSGRCIKD